MMKMNAINVWTRALAGAALLVALAGSASAKGTSPAAVYRIVKGDGRQSYVHGKRFDPTTGRGAVVAAKLLGGDPIYAVVQATGDRKRIIRSHGIGTAAREKVAAHLGLRLGQAVIARATNVTLADGTTPQLQDVTREGHIRVLVLSSARDGRREFLPDGSGIIGTFLVPVHVGADMRVTLGKVTKEKMAVQQYRSAIIR